MNTLCHRYLNQNILPFVGREPELKRLRKLFRLFLESGETKYVLVSGESGSGKSRLVREFEDHVAQEFGDSCVTIHVRYLEGNAAALTPILNAFAAALGHHDGIRQFLETQGVLRPGQMRFTGEHLEEAAEPGPPPLQMLLDSLRAIATRFPLALILEDIHNVEDLPLFDQFFLGLSSASKFIIFTERTGGRGVARDRASEQFMREIALREERTSDVVTLEDLVRPDIDRLFEMLFEFKASTDLLNHVIERTSNRPLNLRTMLRQLVTNGALQYDEGVWSEDPNAVLSADRESRHGEDETLIRFQRELERLNEHELLVAIHAAILGEQFDIRLVRQIILERLGADAISDEIFQRSVDLLTFKSIIRPATPSIYLAWEPGATDRADIAKYCFEFAHQNFWSTVLESAQKHVAAEHALILSIVTIAGKAHLPLYSSAFLAITGQAFMLTKTPEVIERVEYFLRWASLAVRSLWSVEPQQALRVLMSLRTIRDEITWRFGPDLSEPAMASLLELHSLLVEAFNRTGRLRDAERDLEHAAVLDKFIQSAKTYSTSFQGIARGKVTTLRAILAAGRTSYQEFERWATTAREALLAVSPDDTERARLLALLTRTKAEALLNVGKFIEADALIEREMPIAQLLRDSRFDEYCLYYRVAVTSKLKQDQNAQARELTERIIAEAKQRGNTLIETTFLFQAALASFSMGRIAEARAACDLGIANGRRYGIRFVEIMSNLWRMIIAGVEQDLDTVRERSQQLASLVEDARIVAQAPNLLQRISLIEGRATTMNFLGRHGAALEYAEEAIQLAGTHHQDSFAAWAQNEKALALNGLGRYDEALAVARECLAMCGEQKLAARTARVAILLAETGLAHFEEAWSQAERIRTEFQETNPYYFRFAVAECRLIRESLQSTDALTRSRSNAAQLRIKLSRILQILAEWGATALSESVQKEFSEFLPRKSTLHKIGKAIAASPDGVPANRARLLVRTFGTICAEPWSDGGDASPLDTLSTNPKTGDAKSRDSKVKQLLAVLIVARMESTRSKLHDIPGGLDKETLVDLLWPDSDPTSGSNALYTTIKRLRAFLNNQDAILFSEGSYSLAPMVLLDCEVLQEHFSNAKLAAKKNTLFSVTFHYEQILRIAGKGPFLEGIYATWLEGVRSKLESMRRTAAIRLIQTNLDRGLLDKAEELSHFLLTQDEYDEEAMRGLLIATHRRGQNSRLFGLYDTFAQKLQSEFSSGPSEDLKQLYTDLVALPESG